VIYCKCYDLVVVWLENMSCYVASQSHRKDLHSRIKPQVNDLTTFCITLGYIALG